MIIGPGALGTLYAARLAAAGVPVTLLDYRPDRAAALQAAGLTVVGDAPRRVPVTADPRVLGQTEITLVLVKAYQTEQVATVLAEFLAPGAVAVTLQNGLGNLDTLQLHLGLARVLAGTTTQGAILERPGMVRDTGAGVTTLGVPASGPAARLGEVTDVLMRAGFTVSQAADIQVALWTKAILNAAINPVAALTGQRNGALVEQDASLQVMTAAAREASAIARRHGIALPRQDWRARLITVCRATATNINSMLADVRQHRRTEITALNGAIVRAAEQHHLPASVNRTLWLLVETLERGYVSARE